MPSFGKFQESLEKFHIDEKTISQINEGYEIIDSKIPKEKRDSWPVVVDSKGEIIWLPGIKKSKFDKANKESY